MLIVRRLHTSHKATVFAHDGAVVARVYPTSATRRSTSVALSAAGYKIVGNWVRDPYADDDYAFATTL